MVSTGKSLKTRLMSVILTLAILLGITVPLTSVRAAASESYASMTASTSTVSTTSGDSLEILAGTNTYSIFNSGATTSDGWGKYRNPNPAPSTYNNNGYDLYGTIGSASTRTFRLGQSFTVKAEIKEQSILTIKGWDIDEDVRDCGYGYEYDYIYLVDENTGTSVQLDGHMSGTNNTWTNSSFKIAPSLLEMGHTYHFELTMSCTGSHSCGYYSVAVRTVSLLVSGEGASSAPATGIEYADLSGSISNDGTVSVSLAANAYAADNYILEYKAVYAVNGAQRGFKEYSVTVPTQEEIFNTSFYLDYGSDRGTYIITVFIKDSSGTVVATRDLTVSYGYSAVSYNSNGGSQNLPSDTTNYSSGDTVSVRFDYIPSRSGYAFLGWSTDRYATEPDFTENGVNTFTIGSSDVTLYAVWQEGSVAPPPSSPVGDTWDGTVANGFGGGNGTEASPYLIYTAAELAYLANSTNSGNNYSGEYFKLMSNINLNNLEWTPIGKDVLTAFSSGYIPQYTFSGTFDGNNFTIYNLVIKNNNTSFAGLFGTANGAAIRNLSIVGAEVDNRNVGSNRSKAGGLIGYGCDITVERCSVIDADICGVATSDPSSAGGLVGIARGTSTIRNCYVNADVSGNGHVAGLVGGDYTGIGFTIENCYATGTVTFLSENNDSVSRCLAGIIAYSDSSSTVIRNCFYVGEFVFQRTVEYGPVKCNDSNLYNCYYNVNGDFSSTLGTYTELSSFKSESFIESNLGWDFYKIWTFDTSSGYEYPILRGFNQPSTSGHIESDWIYDVEPTCTAGGHRYKICTKCNEILASEYVAPGHDFVITSELEATCTDDGYIVMECQREGCECTKQQIIIAPGHSFGGDNICDVCGFTVEIHEHEFDETVVDATCTNIGYTVYACSCGYEYRSSYVDQLGHSWGEGEVVAGKTCDTPGVMKYTCTTCGTDYEVEIPAGHDWVESVTLEATCTDDGILTRACSACGETEEVVIPAAHTLDEGTVITEATCTEPGEKLCTCTVCGESVEVEIGALGHRFVNGACTVCGAKIPDIVTPDSDHPEYGMYFEIDDIISNYGPEYINEYGVLLDYNSDAVIKKVAVYLTQDGTMWRRCIACVGENITYATYVPYLSYDENIYYSGLNSEWINIFRLSENSDGIWCYSDYTTIGVNLQDNQGNLLLSLYDIGAAGAKTRIFDDLDEMVAWLLDGDGCIYHNESDWIIDSYPTESFGGHKHKECLECGAVTETEIIPALASIRIENITVNPGSTVSITVDIRNNPGILGAAITFEYDPSLTLISATAGGAWSLLTMTYPADYYTPCTFVWDGIDRADYANGTIITLTFELPDGAEIGTVYGISAYYASGNVVDSNCEPIDIAIYGGSISVESLIGDVNEDGVVDVADIVTLRRYIAGGYDVNVNSEQADINADGEITVSDIIALRRYILN